MTFRSLPNQVIPSAPSSASSLSYILWAWLNFMRQPSPTGPGWTVVRSSNGSVGGAGDNISTSSTTGPQQLHVYSGSVARGWFVLRSPDGKKEWMVAKEASTGQFRFHYVHDAVAAPFTGGDVWNYPSGGTYYHATTPSNYSFQAVLHCIADDAAPYGFWFHARQSGVISGAAQDYSFVWAPFDLVSVTGDLDPYWSYHNANCNYGFERNTLSAESASYITIRAFKPNTSSYYLVTPLHLRNDNDYCIPSYIELSPAQEDVTFPITFARRAALGNGFFKGVTSFMQWNGRYRAIGEMQASRSRVVIGEVTLPWDGVSAFLMS